MKPSEALTAHRDELRRLVSRYGLSRPRIRVAFKESPEVQDAVVRDIEIIGEAVNRIKQHVAGLHQTAS